MSVAERPRQRVLLVEDDLSVAMMLTDRLEAKGYSVDHASNAADAESMLSQCRPDLIILDLMLPDTNGLVLCADLKGRPEVPIIICSATKRKDDPILGLKLGADDFIAKPFSVDELLARMEAALRRPAPGAAPGSPYPPGGQRIGELVIDQARCQVTLGGERLGLTPTEYRLLCVLASRPDEVFSREELSKRVWGYHDVGVGRSLDVHMRRLRAKLNAGVVTPPSLVTLRGFGYKIVHEPRAGAAP